MSSPDSLSSDAARQFRYDALHRDDADPTKGYEPVVELSLDELAACVGGIGNARRIHDLARQAQAIDYIGTELSDETIPPEHPLGL